MQNVPLMTQWGEGTADKPWIIKSVLAGDSLSGRSTVFLRLKEQEYKRDEAEVAIGIAFKALKLPEKNVTHQLWNAPRGGDRFKSVSRLFYKATHIAILVVNTGFVDQPHRIKSEMAG